MSRLPRFVVPSFRAHAAKVRHRASNLLLWSLVALAIESPTALRAQQGPPVINSQPQSQNAFAGATVQFNVSATGSQPLSYRWFGPAGPIANGTNSTLKIVGVDESDAGVYFVRVSNSIDVVRSSDATLAVMRADFGDAPSPYPTLLSANGARHTVVPGIHLGADISFEPDGQPDSNANLDTYDDGIIFGNALVPGGVCTVRVLASANGRLDGWIDFNANGSWDAVERICNSLLLSAGINQFTFTVPTTAAVANTYARFRFSTQGDLQPTGLARDGEVEDYRVSIFAAAADLCVTATDSPKEVLPLDTANVLLSLVNLGPSTARAVVLSNSISGADIVSVDAPSGACS